MKQTTDNDDGSSITVQAGQRKMRKAFFKKAASFFAKAICITGIAFVSFKMINNARGCVAKQDHKLDQEATILVQYAADGRACKCWVTHNSGDVIVSGPSAAIRISDWKSYTFYSKTLGADPNICDVWNWTGKDSEVIE